jgi:KRAB domain-containing zinc finger protein
VPFSNNLNLEETEEQQFVVEDVKMEEEEGIDGYADGYLVEEFVEAHEGETETDEEFHNSLEQASSNKRSRVGVIKSDKEPGTSIQCQLCSKTFDRKEYYRRHYRRAHMNNEENDDLKKTTIFQCDLCGKISTSHDDYENHQRDHDGELRFKCNECSMRFISKAEARKHANETHTDSSNIKPFACNMCSKSFKNRYQLVLHNRSHTGEKPFQCPICFKTFSMSSNLQKHFDIHSNDKAYSCVSKLFLLLINSKNH